MTYPDKYQITFRCNKSTFYDLKFCKTMSKDTRIPCPLSFESTARVYSCV